MSKIKINSLVQNEVRAVIPFINDEGKNEHIIVKNPTRELREELSNLIYKGMEDASIKVDEEELVAKLMNELTNIELNMTIKELMNINLSYELESVFFHLTEILNEITCLTYMNTSVRLSEIEKSMLMKEVGDKVNKIEKAKNTNTKEVKKGRPKKVK